MSNDLGSGFPVYQVPQRTITIDGNTNDWAGAAPAIVDPTGDGNPVQGSYIRALYLTRDGVNICARIDIANGPPGASLYFGINFRRNEMTAVEATGGAADR